MNTMTVGEASNNLSDVITRTIDNSDETVIVSNDGAVVMVAESYWEAIQETLRLLRDKRSLKALLEGHHHRETGQLMQTKTADEVFNDLQN
ncbi:MAG: type II toxin-antitoxin system Phd/YefM family antitoxin [Caldilineaceae bacterium]|nr:type II toxin-antitoxin system Phd/YefM family antitoxin [Caldilineaceae bacterium]